MPTAHDEWSFTMNMLAKGAIDVDRATRGVRACGCGKYMCISLIIETLV